MRTRRLNWLLMVASLLISTAPLYAQRQQGNVATRNLVGIKAKALAEKIAELYKKMGPEFAALIDIEKIPSCTAHVRFRG
jgi:hypothetical protein